MADFVQKSTMKSTIMNLMALLESMTVFQNLITDIVITIGTLADAYAGGILAYISLFSIRGGKMNWRFIVVGGLFLVLAGLIGADYISTSITTDGSFLLASSGQTENGTYASRVMATDTAEITHAMTRDDSLTADVSVTSAGPIQVSDYASGKSVSTLPDNFGWVFVKSTQNREPDSEL